MLRPSGFVCALGNVAVKALVEFAAFCHMVLELLAVYKPIFGGQRGFIVMFGLQFNAKIVRYYAKRCVELLK